MNDTLHQFQSVLLIGDASSSARLQWEKVVATISQLLQRLPPESLEAVHVLGKQESLPVNYFVQKGMPPPGNFGSFVAPILSGLKRRRQSVDLAILVGSGQVFDLEDWLGSPWVKCWGLVRIGNESLKPPGVNQPEFEAEELDSLFAWMEVQRPAPPVISRRAEGLWVQGDQRWALDETGYPLVWVPPLSAWWSLFPVTKFQFEAFLAENSQILDDAGYQNVLALNLRSSFQSKDLSQYEQLLVTGLLPQEAQSFARWQGPIYRLPTPKEWRTAYRWLDEQPHSSSPIELERAGQSEAACQIWEKLQRHLRPSSLLDLSLMGQGVIEWLFVSGEPVGGLGHTRPVFRPKLIDPLVDEPVHPIHFSQRLKYFGFRLMRSET